MAKGGAKLADGAAIRRGWLAFAAGRYAEAAGGCEALLRKNRRHVEALHLLGTIELAQGALESATKRLEQCVAILPRNAVLRAALGSALAVRGRHDAARAEFNRALALAPGLAAAISGKAGICERAGAFDEARALLAPLVEAGKENVVQAALWARLALREGRYDDVIAICARHEGDPVVVPTNHRQLYSLAGKAHERRGDADAAFAAYERSNALERGRFDLHSHLADLGAIMRVGTRETLRRIATASPGGPSPVFVVGMPRTGSTLIEQILDAHPECVGAGESGVLTGLVSSMMFDIGAYRPYPECLRDLTAEHADRMARDYVERTAAEVGRAGRIVDKSLVNYAHLGLVSRLFPGAHVIHCRRDPLDTCLSCFAEVLPFSAHPYTCNLAHLGAVYRKHEEVMDHWSRELDLPILAVQYEALVADPEPQVRRLVEFCGLPWDDACLRFHETGRIVKTASYDQVRRPVYQTSVARHVAFARHLGPLRRALGMEDTVPGGAATSP